MRTRSSPFVRRAPAVDSFVLRADPSLPGSPLFPSELANVSSNDPLSLRSPPLATTSSASPSLEESLRALSLLAPLQLPGNRACRRLPPACPFILCCAKRTDDVLLRPDILCATDKRIM